MDLPLQFEDCPFYHFKIHKFIPNFNGMYFENDEFTAFIKKNDYETICTLGEDQIYDYNFLGVTYQVKLINVKNSMENFSGYYKITGTLLAGGVNIESF